MKEFSPIGVHNEVILQQDPFFAEIGLHGNKPIFGKSIAIPTIPLAEQILQSPGRPIICTFDFHDTLVDGREKKEFEGAEQEQFAEALNKFHASVPDNPIHFALNTGSLRDLSTGVDMPTLQANGLLQPLEIGGVTIADIEHAERWQHLYGQLNAYFKHDDPPAYRFNIHKKDHPWLTVLPPQEIAHVLEDAIDPELSSEAYVFIDSRKERIIVRSRFMKEEGNRAFATRHGYNPDEPIYMHFGDFIHDVPVGKSKPNSYYFVCSQQNRPFIRNRAAIISPHSTSTFVPQELAKLSEKLS
jgi:hypothetical protein